MKTQPSPSPSPGVYVWDPLVRVGHWLLVATFAIGYLTGEDQAGLSEILHVWSGYLIGAIVVLRVAWGIVGPRHARFSDFLYTPAKVTHYFLDLIKGRARRYIGHSPAGGAMVIALLFFLAATVATGLMAYGNEGKGPLASASSPVISGSYANAGTAHTPPAAAPGMNASASARDENYAPSRAAQSAGDDLLEELHGLLANITLGLVILHVLGVALASIVHHENLVAAMINGRKRADTIQR